MKSTKMMKLALISLVSLTTFGVAGMHADGVQAASTSKFGIGYVNYIPGSGIPVYSTPNGTKTGQTLPTGSAWKVWSSQYNSKIGIWFNVGKNQWVDANYMVNKSAVVYDNGVAIDFQKTIKIDKAVTVYMMPGGYPTKASLAVGATYKTLQVTTIHDGTTWFNIGLNQWIPAANVSLL